LGAQRDLATVGEAQLRIAVALGGDHIADGDARLLREHAHRSVGLLRRERAGEELHGALGECEHRREQRSRRKRAHDAFRAHLHAATPFFLSSLSFLPWSSSGGGLPRLPATTTPCITALGPTDEVPVAVTSPSRDPEPAIPVAPASPPVRPPTPPTPPP